MTNYNTMTFDQLTNLTLSELSELELVLQSKHARYLVNIVCDKKSIYDIATICDKNSLYNVRNVDDKNNTYSITNVGDYNR